MKPHLEITNWDLMGLYLLKPENQWLIKEYKELEREREERVKDDMVDRWLRQLEREAREGL